MIKVECSALERAVYVIAGDVAEKLSQREFIANDERDNWRELTTCVLSSQVPYALAVAAADAVCASGIFASNECYVADSVEADLHDILRTEIDVEGTKRRYRFPTTKSKQLAAALITIQSEFGSLSAALSGLSAPDLRIWLVENVPGMGPKQASMFLRNVGVTDQFAILDRHVIHFMVALRKWREVPTNLSSLPRYLEREQTVKSYAKKLGHSVGAVDWAIWIVMRAASSMA